MKILFVAGALILASMLCPTQAAEWHGPNSWIESNGRVHIYGLDGLESWYDRKPRPETLKTALAAEKSFLGGGNPYWKGHRADKKTCLALQSVGLTCDYNTRVVLSVFLTVNGKGLFPASGHTNPFVDAHDPKEGPDDTFIGRAIQNKTLAGAVRRNAKLFRNGDLSAKDVRQKWR